MEVVHLTPGRPAYERYTALLDEQPLRSQWWADAESRHKPDVVSYLMVLVDDGAGGQVPAAWAGYAVDGGTLRCCNNYVRREYRGRHPELYAVAYTARHRRVVLRMGLPAVTYLFAQPIGLHEADGWVKDTGPDAHGTSLVVPGEPHPWWRLRWTPGAATATVPR